YGDYLFTDSNGIIGLAAIGRAMPSPINDAPGATVFSNVPDGKFAVQVTGLPTGAYITDIRENGVSIFDSGFKADSTVPGEIQVMVNLSDVVVQGEVFDAGQKPVGIAKVVLVPEQSRRMNATLYKTAFTNAAGHFVLHGVAPGMYKVFAWENTPKPAAPW